jgi:hypothetical protein
MCAHVRGVIRVQFEISESVVSPVTVEVMHNFGSREVAADVLSND